VPQGLVSPAHNIDALVDSASGYKMLSFLDAFSGYNQLDASPRRVQNDIHDQNVLLLLQDHAVWVEERRRHLSKIDGQGPCTHAG